MAKKKKKTRRQRKEAVAKKQTGKVQSRASAPAETSNVVGKLRGREFNPDYSYVVDDLRRIGFLATFFIAALVVLSFILN